MGTPGKASVQALADGFPLVGRAREQATLGECLTAALAGRGGLVLLGGEAGIGKTALAEVLLVEARARGALVLTGHAYDLSDTPPYGPWTECLAQCRRAPDLPPSPAIVADLGIEGSSSTQAGSQMALFVETFAYFAALALIHPLVLLLEDLHWADPASLDLLRYLARQLTDLPVLVVVTYRADELTRQQALFGLLPVLVHDGRALRLDLRRLDDKALQSLIGMHYQLAQAEEARLATYLRARTEGNPLFVGEVLRTLEAVAVLRRLDGGWELGELRGVRVPPFLREVIESRLVRLGEAARHLLAVAAVIGQEVPLAVWREVASVDEETLLTVVERAVETHLLAELSDGCGVRFEHALIREALYEGLLAPRRQGWHRRVAEALLGQPAPDPDAVAYHFRQAGDARAADWLIRAGERARGAYAWLTAAARFEAALPFVPAEGAAPERCALLGYLAWLRRYAYPRQAVAHMDEAFALARAAGDLATLAATRVFRGIFRCYAGALRQGLDELEEGVAAVDALPEGERERLASLGTPAALLAGNSGRGTLALWLALAGQLHRAQESGERTVDQHPGDAVPVLGASVLGDAYQGLGLAHAALGRPDDARQAFAQARKVFERVEHHYQWATTAAFELQEVAIPFLADQPAARQQLAVQAEQEWSRSSGVWSDLSPAMAYLPLLLLSGRWAEARKAALEASASEGIINQRLFAARVLGPLALYRGETDLAWAQVLAVLPAGPSSEPGDTWLSTALELQLVAAHLAIASGDLSAAREWLEAHDRWLASSGSVLGRAEGHLGWASYYRAAVAPERAAERAAHALDCATTPRQPLALLGTYRILGQLDTAANRLEAAGTHLDASLSLARSCAAPYEEALTLLSLADFCIVERKMGDAAANLNRAAEILEPLEAQIALARLAGLKARLGHRAVAPAYPAGLSAREVEVLQLVAEGLSSAEVAERLVLSPRTVEQHLRSIYNKLGVSSRAAATRFAVLHHLGDYGSSDEDLESDGSSAQQGTLRYRCIRLNGNGWLNACKRSQAESPVSHGRLRATAVRPLTRLRARHRRNDHAVAG